VAAIRLFIYSIELAEHLEFADLCGKLPTQDAQTSNLYAGLALTGLAAEATRASLIPLEQAALLGVGKDWRLKARSIEVGWLRQARDPDALLGRYSLLVEGGLENGLATPTPTRDVSHPAQSFTPSAQPLLTIEGGRKWIGFELYDLWAHRDLFYILAMRDVRVRYKQTMLGALWAILQPFLTMIVFTILFGKLARVPSDGEPYAIFSYAALVPWNFFNSALTSSSNSLVGSANLITKVYFPRLIIPGAAVGAVLVDFIIASGILFVMMACYGVSCSLNLIMFLPLALLTTLIALATGMWLSALNVKYRDVRYAVPFVLQIWMFLTPVIYPVTFIPQHWRWALALNPLTAVIEGFRNAIFGRPFHWMELAISTSIGFSMLIYAAYAFRRMEREFADVI